VDVQGCSRLPTNHELSAANLQESGEVLDFVRSGQLTTGCYAESHEALIHDSCTSLAGPPNLQRRRLTLQVGSRRIDGCSVAGWARAMGLSVSDRKRDRASSWWGGCSITTKRVATYPITAYSLALYQKLELGRYSLTTFECILLESTFGIAVKLEAVESPAVGDTRWLCEAAAATGTENKDRKRGDALLKLEANRLAAFAGLSWEACYVRVDVGVVVGWRGSRCFVKCA
jgi:hypothetical protein